MANEDERIREKAYFIWLAEGQPQGHDLDHWERARVLIEVEAEVPVEEGTSTVEELGTAAPEEAPVASEPAVTTSTESGSFPPMEDPSPAFVSGGWPRSEV